MKQFISAAAALLYTTANAQIEARGSDCKGTPVNDGGNWYCSKVEAITYNGVGGENSYNKITNMNGDSGSCESAPFGYSGSMSPLDEEVRGIAMRTRVAHNGYATRTFETVPSTNSTSGLHAHPWSHQAQAVRRLHP